MAEDAVNALFIQVAHLVCAKKWASVFPVKEITTGKPTDDKLTALVHTWVRWADAKLANAYKTFTL